MLKSNTHSKEKDTSVHMSHRVMERIHAEHIVPKPAYAFLLQNALLGLAISLSAFVGIFFTSVVFFRLTGIHLFGNRFLFEHFPWFAGGFALCGILVTFALLEYYKVFYRYSLLSVFITICIVFATLGFLFNKTPMHTKLMQSRIGGIYSVEEKPLQVYAGRVIETRTSGSFVLETLRGEQLKMYVPTNTRLPQGGLVEGQSLFVAGSYQSGQFIVKGVLSMSR